MTEQLAPDAASERLQAASPRHRQLLDGLPQRPGVYRLHGAGDALLYVGKSINIRSRVMSHCRGDDDSRRHQQMIRQLQRVDFTVTAGELGALLLEARQIKQLQPLYNRRLRRQRSLLSLRLDAERQVHWVSRIEPRAEAPLYGLFRNRRQAVEGLSQLAREHRLCLRQLGLESGRGRCFARQLGQCAGACCGEESPEQHAWRLLAALQPWQLAVWPWSGPVALVEHDPRFGLSEWHVFNHWCHLGSTASQTELTSLAAAGGEFDRDTYYLLLGWLHQHPDCEVQPL